MSRSNREDREEKHKYASARERADKQAQGFQATYLKLPDKVQLFKPKPGTLLLDIMAYEVGEGNPFAKPGRLYYERTYYAHRGIGANNEMYICPRLTSKKPCPICEYRAKLMRKTDDESEAIVKDLAPKQRQLFNVLDLKNPDKGVQIWDISFHLFGKILDARIRASDDDEGWELFFTLDEGMSLRISMAEESFGGKSFGKADSIDFKPRKEQYDDDMLDEVTCLDDILIEMEYDALKKAFIEAPKKSAEDDDDDKDEERSSRGKRSSWEEEDEDKPRRRKREDDDEKDNDKDEGDDEKPRKRKRAEDDEKDGDEEDERPKKKRVLDEDDEKPRRKRSDEDDEKDKDDDEEKPRRRSRDEDDEEKPRRKRDAEDDDEPKGKKKKDDDGEDTWDDFAKDREGDEDDEKPKRRKDKDEDDEEKPRRKRVEDADDEEKPRRSRKRED